MCFCVALIIILTCSFVSVRVATALCRAPVSLPLSLSPSRSLSHSLAFFIAVVLASHSARAKNVINLMISIKCSPVQGRSGLVEVRPEGSRECKVAMEWEMAGAVGDVRRTDLPSPTLPHYWGN